jgi:hypothetical protein
VLRRLRHRPVSPACCPLVAAASPASRTARASLCRLCADAGTSCHLLPPPRRMLYLGCHGSCRAVNMTGSLPDSLSALTNLESL